MKINQQAQHFDKPISKAIKNAYHIINFGLVFLSSHDKKGNFPDKVFQKGTCSRKYFLTVCH